MDVDGIIPELLRALLFAADRHRAQRRKDPQQTPYINHPIGVAECLARVAGVEDLSVLQAAILHDAVEDTDTTFDEIEQLFGNEVRTLVAEVSDDKSLPKEERKRLQIVHAPELSDSAKLIKIADKIANVRDVSHTPPPDWPAERRLEYLEWAEKVVAGCRGVDAELDAHFDRILTEGRKKLAD